MKVRFTTSARKTFLEAIRYISRERPLAAQRFRSKVLSKLRRLEDFPDSGRRLPEFPELPAREMLVPPYRFFYRVSDTAIWIVGVWHDAQLPKQPDEAP